MPGLESSFWRGIRLQRRRGEEKTFQAPKSFFRRRHSKQSYRPDFPPCHRLIFFWRGIRLQRRQGEEKNFCGPDFFRCRHTKQSYRPDIPPCQGLKVYFGVVAKEAAGRRKHFFRSQKVFSGAGIPNKAIGQIFHHATAWKFIFAWY